MSYVEFRSEGAILRGRLITTGEETVKVHVEGELFERVLSKTDITRWITPRSTGRRARPRRVHGHARVRHDGRRNS